MKISQIQNTFNAGEWSPRMSGRTDVAKYANACLLLENFLIHPQGGATYRPGWRFIAETKTSTSVSRMVGFRFSTEQAYILEFGNLYIRFYKDQGRIETGGSPYEIASPYAAADLSGLKFAQSADVLYIVHPDYAPRKLSRTGHTSWTLTTISFPDGPYLPENDVTSLTLTPSATTGTITLTASAALFTASQVGALFRLRHNGSSMIVDVSSEAYESGSLPIYGKYWVDLTPNINDGWSGKVTIQRSIDGAATWMDEAVFTGVAERDFFETEVGVIYRIVCKAGEYSSGSCQVSLYQTQHWGVVRITAFTSATSVAAVVVSLLGGTMATHQWMEGAWSDARGWPSCVCFFKERLCFANTAYQPQTFWASSAGKYEYFAPSILDDAPLTLTLLSDQVNAILWMVSRGNSLVLGSTDGPWQLSATNAAEPLTPTNFDIVKQIVHGSQDLSPVEAGAAILFVERAERKLRELVYDFQSDSYLAPDLTLLAEHITRTGIVDTAYQLNPDPTVWVVRADGVLAGMSYERGQNVVAWHRHVTDGNVESVATIPGADRDEVWLLVRRTINGVTRRYVELLENNEWAATKADYFHVDCGLTYSGTPVATVSGLTHLFGKTVSILGDGAQFPQQVVSASGELTISKACSKIHVGLPFTGKLSPMPIEVPSQLGTAQGQTKRLVSVILRLLNSLGGRIGIDEGNLELISYRVPEDPMDASPPLFTGDVVVSYRGGYSRSGNVTIVHDIPLPFTITAIVRQMQGLDQ